MGLETIAALAVLSSMASGVQAGAQATKDRGTTHLPTASAAALAGEKEAKIRGRSKGRTSTLATAGGGGGLSESPTLGRPSLLGGAARA